MLVNCADRMTERVRGLLSAAEHPEVMFGGPSLCAVEAL